MINKVAERLLRIDTVGAVGRMYRDVLREEHYEAIRSLYREAGEAAGGRSNARWSSSWMRNGSRSGSA